jgi:pimeloyl-ACP methyl ester carboxylesterase
MNGRRQAGIAAHLAVVVALLPMLVVGCATLPGTTRVVGHQRVEVAQAGQGTPVVVLAHGLGGTMDWWAKVFPAVARETTVFAYDRPGYGDSDKTAAPRDGNHIVEELRVLLRASRLAPPYVLVGHSLGGLYMQLYARRYPAETAALILVDSTHPMQFDGAGAPERWPLWLRVLFSVMTSSTAKAELAGVPATGKVVLALPPFTGGPVVVLSAQQPMTEDSALAREANEKRLDIVRLYLDCVKICKKINVINGLRESIVRKKSS